MLLFSPRMRGCFCFAELRFCNLGVLPAYAGMFPIGAQGYQHTTSSPRVCGDVSKPIDQLIDIDVFSPRMRGCFSWAFLGLKRLAVLPAYAGMFPKDFEKP